MDASHSEVRAIWWPTVDYEKCVGCQDCYNFCKHAVYEWDADAGHPVVTHPENCVPGCKACAKICDQEAISFPERTIWCTCGGGGEEDEAGGVAP
jgi:NAD-dependent dihydropyrimidine dehydrogenase PreA subunit